MLTKLNIYENASWHYLCERVWQKAEDQTQGQIGDIPLAYTFTDVQQKIYGHYGSEYKDSIIESI